MPSLGVKLKPVCGITYSISDPICCGSGAVMAAGSMCMRLSTCGWVSASNLIIDAALMSIRIQLSCKFSRKFPYYSLKVAG